MSKPTRCIDPVVKHCQGCEWGYCDYHVDYPQYFDVFCILGFDQGRPEDEPTQEELDEYKKWEESVKRNG